MASKSWRDLLIAYAKWSNSIRLASAGGGGKGGGSTSSNTQQNQNVSYNPYSQPNIADIYNRAAFTANTPYQPYSGQMVAGLDPSQQAGINNANYYANYAQPWMNSATGMIGQGAADTQQASGLIGGGAQYAMQGAAPINPWAIQSYMNPYTQNVIGTTLANINEQNQQQQQQLQGNAAAQGALGGDRSAVMQAELARQQALASNQTIAGLQQGNYQQALGAAQQDAARRLQASGQLGSLAGQANIQGAVLGGLGQGQAGVGSQAQMLGLQGANAQLGAGQIAQQVQQAQLTGQYQQYLQALAYPYQQAQFLANIGLPASGAMGGYQTQTGTTGQVITPPGMSWGQALAGGALIGSGFLGNSDTTGGTGFASGGSVPHKAGGGDISATPSGQAVDAMPTTPPPGGSPTPWPSTLGMMGPQSSEMGGMMGMMAPYYGGGYGKGGAGYTPYYNPQPMLSQQGASNPFAQANSNSPEQWNPYSQLGYTSAFSNTAMPQILPHIQPQFISSPMVGTSFHQNADGSWETTPGTPASSGSAGMGDAGNPFQGMQFNQSNGLYSAVGNDPVDLAVNWSPVYTDTTDGSTPNLAGYRYTPNGGPGAIQYNGAYGNNRGGRIPHKAYGGPLDTGSLANEYLSPYAQPYMSAMNDPSSVDMFGVQPFFAAGGAIPHKEGGGPLDESLMPWNMGPLNITGGGIPGTPGGSSSMGGMSSLGPIPGNQIKPMPPMITGTKTSGGSGGNPLGSAQQLMKMGQGMKGMFGGKGATPGMPGGDPSSVGVGAAGGNNLGPTVTGIKSPDMPVTGGTPGGSSGGMGGGISGAAHSAASDIGIGAGQGANMMGGPGSADFGMGALSDTSGLGGGVADMSGSAAEAVGMAPEAAASAVAEATPALASIGGDAAAAGIGSVGKGLGSAGKGAAMLLNRGGRTLPHKAGGGSMMDPSMMSGMGGGSQENLLAKAFSLEYNQQLREAFQKQQQQGQQPPPQMQQQARGGAIGHYDDGGFVDTPDISFPADDTFSLPESDLGGPDTMPVDHTTDMMPKGDVQLPTGNDVPLPTPDPRDVPTSNPIDRTQFYDQINKDPSIVTRMANMVKGEVGLKDPTLARTELESAFNRAQSRNIPLSQSLLSVKDNPRLGYYASDTYTNHAPLSQNQIEDFRNQVLQPVLKGSNVGYDKMGFVPTGNASGQFALNRDARGMYGDSGWYSGKPGRGEMFVTERPDVKFAQNAVTGQPQPSMLASIENKLASAARYLNPVGEAQAGEADAPLPPARPASAGWPNVYDKIAPVDQASPFNVHNWGISDFIHNHMPTWLGGSPSQGGSGIPTPPQQSDAIPLPQPRPTIDSGQTIPVPPARPRQYMSDQPGLGHEDFIPPPHTYGNDRIPVDFPPPDHPQAPPPAIQEVSHRGLTPQQQRALAPQQAPQFHQPSIRDLFTTPEGRMRLGAMILAADPARGTAGAIGQGLGNAVSAQDSLGLKSYGAQAKAVELADKLKNSASLRDHRSFLESKPANQKAIVPYRSSGLGNVLFNPTTGQWTDAAGNVVDPKKLGELYRVGPQDPLAAVYGASANPAPGAAAPAGGGNAAERDAAKAWAKSHPDDPRSQKILERLGEE